jgi:hypothetical protein
MASFPFSAEPMGQDIESEAFIIVMACLAFLLLLAIVIVCLCRRHAQAAAAPPSDAATAVPLQTHSASSVANLIPPLFYTEDLRDPLMQEDLRDHLRALDAPPIHDRAGATSHDPV